MSVERLGVPKKTIEPSSWTSLARLSHESHQLHTTTLVATTTVLPTHDLRPRALVDRVVDGDDSLHVWCLGVVVLAVHGVVELLLGWVHPVRAVGLWDVGDDAIRGERTGAVWGVGGLGRCWSLAAEKRGPY